MSKNKGFIKVSRNLIQKYNELGITNDELCFLLKVLSFKKGEIINPEKFNMNKYYFYRIRKQLLDKNLIIIYEKKSGAIGQPIYVNMKLLVEKIGDESYESKSKNENDKSNTVAVHKNANMNNTFRTLPVEMQEKIIQFCATKNISEYDLNNCDQKTFDAVLSKLKESE